MELEGRVALGASNYSDGSKVPIRLDETGAIIVSQHHSSRYLNSIDGKAFKGMNPLGTPVTTQAGLSATTPMLTLYNPVGSGVNLILDKVSVGVTSAPAGSCVIALAYNAQNATPPATTTLANVTSTIVGTVAQPVGQCYRVATLAAAPTMFSIIGNFVAASSTTATVISNYYDGTVIIPPGVAISIQTSAALSGVAVITWFEEKIV